jgi:hypothetical protein
MWIVIIRMALFVLETSFSIMENVPLKRCYYNMNVSTRIEIFASFLAYSYAFINTAWLLEKRFTTANT